MSKPFPKDKIIIIFLFIFFFNPFFVEPIFAQTQEELNIKGAPLKEELTELQRQARIYREQGLRLQQAGKIEQALSFYQKAIEVDPYYAIAYNDLGVIYETKGLIDRAEEHYLKAIKIDPNCLSAYSNLALLYETKRDLDMASFYWKKRAELGLPDDPWTEKARARLEDLARIKPDYRQRLVESETISLMRQMEEFKKQKKIEDLKKAEEYFALAKKLYFQGEYEKAKEEIEKALSVDPQNKEKFSLKEKIDAALEKQKEKERQKQKYENAKRMKEYFQQGLEKYLEGNLQAAQAEFNRIIELAISPQKN